jgi:predicted Zn-dependent protease
MGVHTGMLTLVNHNDQLAAVIGHEIGHVLADHGNERVSQGMLTQGLVTAGALALGDNPKRDLILMGAMGLAQFGVLMPFSRKHESEADALGVKYMAKAGFDPREAAELWKLMSRKAGKSPPEFMSTHPSPSTRIKALSKLAPKYMRDYIANKYKNNCKSI